MKISFGSTPAGNIDIELYDDQAPKTVANFLRYAGLGDYNNSIIHRSIPGFIIQGGSYLYLTPAQGFFLYAETQSYPPVQNEFSPSRSNIRGTIAMAKLPGQPDSATNGWFFNLSDNNAANLDYQNGGFTVFGNVIDNVSDPGMSVVDAIAAVPTYPPRATCSLPPSPIVTCASVMLPISLPQSKNVPSLDFPLVNYIYDAVSPPSPQPSNLVSVINIPNVSAAATLSGAFIIFTTDVDMTFTGPVAPATPAGTQSLLGTFTPPPNKTVQFNDGIFRFTITGTMPSGRIVTLLNNDTTAPNHYYAYGPTPGNATPHWYDFTFDGTTGAEIVGNKILLHFVDGQRGDDDLAVNDSITHTGAPAQETDITTGSSSSGGCSIAAKPSQTTGNGDWVVVSLFLAFVALVRRRARNEWIQRA